MHADDSGEFRVVKRKNKNSRKSYLIAKESTAASVNEELGDKLKRRLTEIEAEITCEEFYPDLVALLKDKSINRLVCLGLGHFSTCPTSRVQLAFLLALSKAIPIQITLQDPAFTGQETAFLEALHFQVLANNLEGRFSTETGQRVVYFLPHCPKALTNNLLSTNWEAEKLTNSIIICNSFQALLVNTLERDILTEVPHVRRISEFTTETTLRVSERNFDSFNDTSIHRFEAQDLDRITDSDFWRITSPVQPSGSDLEFISNRLQEGLNI